MGSPSFAKRNHCKLDKISEKNQKANRRCSQFIQGQDGRKTEKGVCENKKKTSSV